MNDPHGGWVRHDLSAVRPLSSYAAKRCPVRAQNDVLQPCEKAPPSAFRQALADRGSAFEAEVVHRLQVDGAVAPESDDRAAREAATVRAMEEGAPLIVNGRLPVDEIGLRTGEPDILVRVGDAPVDGRWRYAPVDVKAHGMVRVDTGADVVIQDLSDLAPPDGPRAPHGRKDSTARDDLLQLAHYHRMLQAHGWAPDGAAWGGIIGGEGQVVWYRLDEPYWQTPAKSDGRKRKQRTSLEVYDFEFGFRLDISAVAHQHLDDLTVPLLVEPVRCGECPDCPWREHCSAILEDRHDPSLLPRIGYTHWRAFRDAGIDSIEALGALQAGVAVDGVSDNALEEARLNALAYLGDAPLYLRPGATVDVPRADVEVDVDMENVAAGAYLWGAYVTVRDGTPPVEPGYHSFVRWADELASDHTTEVFEEFWTWLLDLRGACWRDGRSFAAYCWFDGAENRFLRAGAADDDHAGQVETFIASHEWIDLRRWFTDHFVTGRSTSLKEVAPALGFAWSDEDPGGAMSMLWYEDATDPTSSDEQREASRQRLLAYNEDDVKATLHIRDWFEANGADVEVSLRSSGSSSRSAGTSNRTPPR